MINLFSFMLIDLREDRGYLADHMNSNVITSAQVCFLVICFAMIFFFSIFFCGLVGRGQIVA